MRNTIVTTAVFVTIFGCAHAATLVGDQVTFECTNCGPPTNDTFIVTDDAGPELTLFSQLAIDVEETTLRIEWTFNTNGIISDLNFRWSDLNLGGGIAAATINPSSTWGLDGFLVFALDSVTFTNNNDTTVAVGDFLQIDLSSAAPVPVPAAAPLMLIGLSAFGLFGRRGSA